MEKVDEWKKALNDDRFKNEISEQIIKMNLQIEQAKKDLKKIGWAIFGALLSIAFSIIIANIR